MTSEDHRKRDVLLVFNTVTVMFLLLGIIIGIPYLLGTLISGVMTLLFLRKHRRLAAADAHAVAGVDPGPATPPAA